jgi:hypothetical protein
MTLNNFIDLVFAQNNPYATGNHKTITDEVFLLIQNTPDLMHKYQRLIEDKNVGLDKMNQAIGKAVRAKYGLENADSRENNPKSTLIRSHQQFE